MITICKCMNTRQNLCCFYFVESGRLFMFGANDWGQLGLGHNKVLNKPSRVKGMVDDLVIIRMVYNSITANSNYMQ